MQFFYIDYMNNDKKERNIGFLRVENDGISVGLRGVPMQCGESCKVYAVNGNDERILMGEIAIKNGYGMEKLKWKDKVNFVQCMRIEIPLYGSRKGLCIIRDNYPPVHNTEKTMDLQPDTNPAENVGKVASCDTSLMAEHGNHYAEKEQKWRDETDGQDLYAHADAEEIWRLKWHIGGAASRESLPCPIDEIHEDKWQQLLNIYPQVHICPQAQSIVIRPKDAVILTQQYHELATNSFVLHSYYNYRQLLLFRYGESDMPKKEPKYYLGVPGVYYEREQRIAQMFGFEGFENGEARMQQDADNKIYKGCFGYYMKRVEI